MIESMKTTKTYTGCSYCGAYKSLENPIGDVLTQCPSCLRLAFFRQSTPESDSTPNATQAIQARGNNG